MLEFFKYRVCEWLSMFQVCTKCVMDETDPDITFNEAGICNHCEEYDNRVTKYEKENKNKLLKNIVKKIKSDRNKKYDCVIGISGGVDSSYALYKIVEMGLNPLVYHIDNGYDDKIAIKNIDNLVKTLDVDYVKHDVDIDEYKMIQIAFLKSSTPDLEAPTDHANYALQYEYRSKYNTDYIITGNNYRTESHHPTNWSSPAAKDWVYISNIIRMFGTSQKLNFPHFSPFTFILRNMNKGYRIPILNYLDYNQPDAIRILKEECGYKEYGLKHHESIITRFLQTYILPVKFNIDKRKSHLSSLICSSVISRDEALNELENPPLEESKIEDDLHYILEMLEITEDTFYGFMDRKPKFYK